MTLAAVTVFAWMLYSSDAFGLPEPHYLGAAEFRRDIATVTGSFVADGSWSASDAVRVSELIGAGNARRSPNTKVAADLRVSRATVTKWRSRFAESAASSAGQHTAPLPRSKPTCANGPANGTRTPNRSFGPRPPTRSSTPPPPTANELSTRDTSDPNGR